MGLHCALHREWCSLDPRIAPGPIRYVEMSHTQPAPGRRQSLEAVPNSVSARAALSSRPDALGSSRCSRRCGTAPSEPGHGPAGLAWPASDAWRLFWWDRDRCDGSSSPRGSRIHRRVRLPSRRAFGFCFLGKLRAPNPCPSATAGSRAGLAARSARPDGLGVRLQEI